MILAMYKPFIFLLFTIIIATFVPWYIRPVVILISAVAVLDCVARYLQFQKYKDHELTPRLLRYMRGATCTREVAVAIAKYQVNKQYYDMGYRWYHIMPDGWPWCMTKKEWWKTFF